MNDVEQDKILAQLLKDNSYPTTENPWFTQRVLNRLPTRRSHSWIMIVTYVLAAIVCAVTWRSLLTGLDGIVTVRDMTHIALMVTTTLCVIIGAVTSAVRTD